MIIAAFPGCGKTTIEKSHPEKYKDVPTEDLAYLYDGMTPQYHLDFADRVKEVVDNGGIAMMLPIMDTMNLLIADGYEIKVFIPPQGAKEEYMKRYRERGSDEAFLEKIDRVWDMWLHSIVNGDYDTTVMKEGEFLNDYIGEELNE